MMYMSCHVFSVVLLWTLVSNISILSDTQFRRRGANFRPYFSIAPVTTSGDIFCCLEGRSELASSDFKGNVKVIKLIKHQIWMTKHQYLD
jgi:hypothetical protein